MLFHTHLTLFAGFAAASLAAQQPLAVPPAADVATRAPHAATTYAANPRIFQQVLAAELFGGQQVRLHGLTIKVAPQCTSCGVAWEVRLGYAATTPATALTDFAANRAAAPATVFAGDLPVQSDDTVSVPFAKAHDFDPTKGDLLLEIVETRAPRAATVNLEVAHIKPLASTRRRGISGPMAGSGARFGMWSIDARRTGAGADVHLDAYANIVQPRNGQTFFLVGLPGATPVPLDFMGAAGNTLYVQPLIALPSSDRQLVCGGVHDSLTVPVANPGVLSGQTASVQAVTVDSTANQLGLVFTDVLDVTFGNPAARHGRLLFGDRGATTGQFAGTGFATVSMTIAVEQRGQ